MIQIEMELLMQMNMFRKLCQIIPMLQKNGFSLLLTIATIPIWQRYLTMYREQIRRVILSNIWLE